MGALIAETVLFIVVLVLFIAALVIDRAGLRDGDYLRFERHGVLSQRLTLAAFVVAIGAVIVAVPIVGIALAVIVLAWTLWCLPASHRRFVAVAEADFDAQQEAVAAVMFDVSQQPRWMDSVLTAAMETPGFLRKGSVIRQTVRVSGHVLQARLMVSELIPYERLTLTLLVQEARPTDIFEVLPRGVRSQVRYVGEHELSRVGAILTGWTLRSLRSRFVAQRAANLERLRALIVPGRLRTAAEK